MTVQPADQLVPPPPPFGASVLAAHLLAYLSHVRVQRRLAQRSLVIYEAALLRLQRLAQKDDVELLTLQPQQARRWAARLHGEADLGPRSIALLLSVWRGLYRWLGEQQQVALNPFDGLRAPKAPKPLPKALGVDDAVALANFKADGAESAEGAGVDAWAQALDDCIVELLYGCGLRVAELVGLDAVAGKQSQGWVDLPAAEAHVLGKGSKRRSVPLGRAALAALQVWLPLRLQCLQRLQPGEAALLVGPRGARLGPTQVRARLKARALAAGMPAHVHPHMLRHSFASHILQSSGDLRAVQELLGHAHITTTQIYTQLDFQHLAKIYDASHPRAKKKTND